MQRGVLIQPRSGALAALLLAAGLLAACGPERAPGPPAAERPAPPERPAAPEEPRPELFSWFGHRETVTGIAFSPDGSRLASAATEVKLWNSRTGVLLRELPAARGAVAYSPDGVLFATGGEGNVIHFWDTRSWEQQRALRGHSYPVRGLAFSPDGRQLVSFAGLERWERGEGAEADAGEVKLWDLRTGRARWTVETEFFRPLSFSHDGDLLAAGGVVLETTTGSIVRRQRGAFSPTEELFAGTVLKQGSEWRREVGVWDTRAWERLWLKDQPDTTMPYGIDEVAAFTPDGRRLLISYWGEGHGGWTETVEPRTGEKLEDGGLRGNVIGLAFTPDGSLAASCWEGAWERGLMVADLETGRILWGREGTDQTRGRGPVALAFSRDGRWLAAARRGGGRESSGIQLWDLRAGVLQRAVGPDQPLAQALALAAREEGIVCAALERSGGGAALWDFGRGERRWEQSLVGDQWARLWLLPDGSTLLASAGRAWRGGAPLPSPGGVTLLDLETGEPLREVPDLRADALSADASRAAWLGHDQRITVWDVATGQVRRTLAGIARGSYAYPSLPPPLALSRDGSLVAFAAEDRVVRVWEVESGRLVHALAGEQAADIACLEFSPDGRTLASAGVDMELWDLRTGRVRARLEEHRDVVHALAFSPDGTRLATGSREGAVRVWDPAAGRLLATLMFDYEYPVDQWPTPFRATSWLAVTPEGYFAGKERAVGLFLRWRVGDEVFPGEKFAAEFHRPEKVAEALGGG